MNQKAMTFRDLVMEFGTQFDQALNEFLARRRRQYEAFYFDYVLRDICGATITNAGPRADVEGMINQEINFVERPSFEWSGKIHAEWQQLHARIVARLRAADSDLLSDGIEQQLLKLSELGRVQRGRITYQFGELIDSIEQGAELLRSGEFSKARTLAFERFDDTRQIFRAVIEQGAPLTLLRS